MKDFPDLSHWDDGDVSYHAIVAAGIQYVGLKATEGTANTDATYQDGYTRARSVGLGVLSYAYVLPGEGSGDIVHFESVAHLQSGDIQPVVDAEAAGLNFATTQAAMHQLEAAGYKPILYCSLAFFRDVLGSPTQWPLWLAAYRDQMPTNLPADVVLFAWQYTEKGTCPGIGARCDMNRVAWTDEEFKRFLIP